METQFPPGMSQGAASGMFRQLPVNQNASPATGATVNVTATDRDVNLWLTPAGTIATLTISMPDDSLTQVGQKVRIASSQIVTLLTINGASTIYNPLGSLAVGDNYTFEKVASNTWSRMQ